MKQVAVNTRLLVPEKMDGIGRFSYETLMRICTAHPKISFTFIFDRTPPEAFKFPSNVTLKKLNPPARMPILWFLWFEVSLRFYLNRHPFDLFLSPEGWIPGGLKCKSLGIIHDLNFVHHPKNVRWSHRWYLQYFFPKFAKRASRIATVSEFSKKDIANTYGLEANQIDVLYNGVNEVFRPLSIEEQDKTRAKYSAACPYFIFVGTIHPRKNLEHLLLAFDLFKKDQANFKLLVVGNRKWWPADLQRILEGMKHKGDVVFLGRQSDEDLAKLVASAYALCYLPYFEGFGIPILEAFKANTAVICSNLTSMPEVAQDAALLCDPYDELAISKCMSDLAESKKLRLELIQKGKERALFFSWEKSAQLLFESMERSIEHGA